MHSLAWDGALMLPPNRVAFGFTDVRLVRGPEPWSPDRPDTVTQR